MLESKYQAHLIKRLPVILPGCLVLKNDSSYIQGIPDLIILFRDRWAMLEVKGSAKAPRQPNQEYYVRVLGEMSFAAFIYPENEEEVLRDLQQAFTSARHTRFSERL